MPVMMPVVSIGAPAIADSSLRTDSAHAADSAAASTVAHHDSAFPISDACSREALVPQYLVSVSTAVPGDVRDASLMPPHDRGLDVSGDAIPCALLQASMQPRQRAAPFPQLGFSSCSVAKDSVADVELSASDVSIGRTAVAHTDVGDFSKMRTDGDFSNARTDGDDFSTCHRTTNRLLPSFMVSDPAPSRRTSMYFRKYVFLTSLQPRLIYYPQDTSVFCLVVQHVMIPSMFRQCASSPR